MATKGARGANRGPGSHWRPSTPRTPPGERSQARAPTPIPRSHRIGVAGARLPGPCIPKPFPLPTYPGSLRRRGVFPPRTGATRPGYTKPPRRLHHQPPRRLWTPRTARVRPRALCTAREPSPPIPGRYALARSAHSRCPLVQPPAPLKRFILVPPRPPPARPKLDPVPIMGTS